MYCQLHRPVTSGSQVACALGHIGDHIYWAQKAVRLPDAVGFVPPPYFPILHVGITALVLVLVAKAVLLDPLVVLGTLTVKRGRPVWRRRLGGRHGFAEFYARNVVSALIATLGMSTLLNLALLLLFKNNPVGSEHNEIYSQVMRNKLRFGIIF